MNFEFSVVSYTVFFYLNSSATSIKPTSSYELINTVKTLPHSSYYFFHVL